MTIQASKLIASNVGTPVMWRTSLDATHSTPQEVLGSIREDVHPYFGRRRFEYVRFDASTVQGTFLSQVANVAVNNITSGTTTTITTSGLTADIHVGGLLNCLDDAGGAGAAPEGETGVIVANTATLVTIDTNDAFSVSPAVNDDFVIIKPWAVTTSAAGDFAYAVKGVAMADQTQYYYGWVQFYGINPYVRAVAAGTTLPTGESLIVANSGLITDGAGAAVDLRVGRIMHQLTTDTVARRAIVDLFCGSAFKMAGSTA